VRQYIGRNDSEFAGVVVSKRLLKFFLRIHHEWTVPSDRLTNGLPAKQQNLEIRIFAVLFLICCEN